MVASHMSGQGKTKTNINNHQSLNFPCKKKTRPSTHTPTHTYTHLHTYTHTHPHNPPKRNLLPPSHPHNKHHHNKNFSPPSFFFLHTHKSQVEHKLHGGAESIGRPHRQLRVRKGKGCRSLRSMIVRTMCGCNVAMCDVCGVQKAMFSIRTL